MPIFLSTYFSIYLHTYLSLYPFSYLPIYTIKPTYLPNFLQKLNLPIFHFPIYLHTYLSIYPFSYLFIYLFSYLPIYTVKTTYLPNFLQKLSLPIFPFARNHQATAKGGKQVQFSHNCSMAHLERQTIPKAMSRPTVTLDIMANQKESLFQRQ